MGGLIFGVLGCMFAGISIPDLGLGAWGLGPIEPTGGIILLCCDICWGGALWIKTFSCPGWPPLMKMGEFWASRAGGCKGPGVAHVIPCWKLPRVACCC